MTRDEVEAEVKAMNRFKLQNSKTVVPCSYCDGKGKLFTAIFGDPALGYAPNGPCLHCKGTGKSKQVLRLV